MLAEAIESLDEVSRTAVVLRYYENLSSKQIGELLELNATAVDMRLSRARQLLRAKLAANAARDRRTDAVLTAEGWRVLRFWEHEDPDAVVDTICRALGRARPEPPQRRSTPALAGLKPQASR